MCTYELGAGWGLGACTLSGCVPSQARLHASQAQTALDAATIQAMSVQALALAAELEEVKEANRVFQVHPPHTPLTPISLSGAC